MTFSKKEQERQLYRTLRHFNDRVLTAPTDPFIAYRELISKLEQNQVSFTGERMVVNDDMKENYFDALIEHLYRYELACAFVKGKIVLDAASGAGYGTKMLQMAGAGSVYGIDISEESVIQAEKDYGGENTHFRQGDIQHLPLDNESVDVVVSYETIEHIPDGSVWIKESARVLRPGGLFFVSTPNRSVTYPGTYLCERPYYNKYHFYEYTVPELVGELLKEYDIMELYGQTFVKDTDSMGIHLTRQLFGMEVHYIPKNLKHIVGPRLVPLGEVKNEQPKYIVAVCKKKGT
ncbi:class I SAM-dependent methyltransferase [Paenibacillus contaminans]|nr:class I SAM-dependent methyltransferase [Paenibacillus contaminans]